MSLPLPFIHEEVEPVPLAVANLVLAKFHYLGPIRAGRYVLGHHQRGELVQVQVWRWPTARLLPSDGSMLELSRWCITPMADKNAGSWFMSRAVRWLRRNAPQVMQLVSYSELGRHTGSLYRACNWQPWPTHHAERFNADGVGYPSGHGSWDGMRVEAPKMRWRYEVRTIPVHERCG